MSLVETDLRIPRLGAGYSPFEAADLLLSSGALIIENAAPASAIETIKRDLDIWFTLAQKGEGLFYGRETKRFSGVFAKAQSTAHLAIDENILCIINDALKGAPWEGAPCNTFQLHLTQAIGINPGEGAQSLHRDDGMFPFAHDFELMVNVLWPLDDFTEENGATRIVPHSHRWDRKRFAEPDDSVPAVAKAGSAILWLGSTIHGGGANHSAHMRRGLVFSYSLGWLAQAEKLLLSTSPEIARALPERLQRLIGYQVHRPNLGWIEGRDPIEWLHGRVGMVAPAKDYLTPEGEARVRKAAESRSLLSALFRKKRGVAR